MYLLLADETNRNPSDRVNYFIYGGIVVPSSALHEIHQYFEELRGRHGITSGWDLKFDTAYRPATINAERFAELKSEILQSAPGWNVKFLAYIIHHGIVDTRLKRERAFRGAMNTLLYNFNAFLARERTHGMFIVDRFDGAGCLDLLKSIFTHGLDLPAKNARRAINRICLMSASCLGAGHLMSLLDVVIGAFRFCINATRDRLEVARLLYRMVHPLLLASPSNPARIEEWGLFIRPQDVRAPYLVSEYRALREHLCQLGEDDN